MKNQTKSRNETPTKPEQSIQNEDSYSFSTFEHLYDDNDRIFHETRQDEHRSQNRISQVRKEALNLIAIHKAIAVATDSTRNLLNRSKWPSESVIDFIGLFRQHKELQLASIRVEHSLLDKISMEMNYDDKVHTIFDVIDEDCSGYLNANELFTAFNKVDSFDVGHYMMETAQFLIPEYTKDGSEISVVEFRDFLLKLSSGMDTPINDIAKFVVSNMNFGESGRQILETAVSILSTKTIEREHCENSNEMFHQSIIQVRLIFLFDMMDFQTVDRVDLRLLWRFLGPLCEKSENLMERMSKDLSLTASSTVSIEFFEFSEIILQVAAELQMTEHHFHHLFDMITLQTCKQDINELHVREALCCSSDDKNCDQISNGFDEDVHDLLDYGKLCRLFDLFDVNHDGIISRTELVKGLKHYLQQSNTERTILTNHMIVSIMDSKVLEKVLSMPDFANLMAQLACASGSEVHRFIDFLLVQGVCRNEEEEEENEGIPSNITKHTPGKETNARRGRRGAHSKNREPRRKSRDGPKSEALERLSRQISVKLASLKKTNELFQHVVQRNSERIKKKNGTRRSKRRQSQEANGYESSSSHEDSDDKGARHRQPKWRQSRRNLVMHIVTSLERMKPKKNKQ